MSETTTKSFFDVFMAFDYVPAPYIFVNCIYDVSKTDNPPFSGFCRCLVC